MADKYVDVARDIAQAAMLPDFFAARIDEEALYPLTVELITRIKLPGGHPKLDAIKEMAASSANATAFIDLIKTRNFWTPLRELLTKGPVG